MEQWQTSLGSYTLHNNGNIWKHRSFAQMISNNKDTMMLLAYRIKTKENRNLFLDSGEKKNPKNKYLGSSQQNPTQTDIVNCARVLLLFFSPYKLSFFFPLKKPHIKHLHVAYISGSLKCTGYYHEIQNNCVAYWQGYGINNRSAVLRKHSSAFT